MKRTLKFLLCGVIAIVALACTKESIDDSRLSTPNFTATVDGNTITLAWEAVTSAAYYNINVNGAQDIKTDKTVYRITDLEWAKEYTISITAISADKSKKDSEAAVKKVTIAERVAPVYREWYPTNNATAAAISNNGRWVVGGNERNGFILDLNNDKITELMGIELYDVADNGVAVGSNHTTIGDGVATIYIDGIATDIDLSSVTANNSMSCCTGITPDGEYIVGWFWEYDESAYYAGIYGMVIPFCYDVLKNQVTIPEAADQLYPVAATAIKGVAPDRSMIGYEQSNGIFSIVWKDEYTPYEYVDFEYDAEYNPTFAFGDTQNLMSQTGNFVYGKYVEYTDVGEITCPAIYNRTSGQKILFAGNGSVTAMAENGIAFLNDVPYYLGTTSFVVDTTKGEPYVQKPLIDWLLDEYSIDLHKYIIDGFITIGDMEADDSKDLLPGIITIGVSEDNSVLLGITNTGMGWVTYVIDLNGAPLE